MKTILLTAFLICSFTCFALADPESDAKKAAAKVAEQFYDQYVQVENPGPWIKQSKLLTPEFKAAYVVMMKRDDLRADPITNAQDNLSSSVKAKQVLVKGETATATMGLLKDKYGWDGAKVYLVLRDGTWLINGINDILGK